MSIRKIGTSLFLVTIIFIPVRVNAGRGCCSHHGGTAGCTTSGRQICGDGSLSPTCGCTPPAVYGCIDSSASNYNASANQDNGTCIYHTLGCTDVSAENYNPNANQDDGSCKYKIVEEETSEDNGNEIKEYSNYSNNKKEAESNEESDPLSTVIGLGTIAGGAYVYKKIKG